MQSEQAPEYQQITSQTLTALMLGGIIVFVQFILMGWYSWQLPPQIPLFLSLPYGSGQLAPRYWLIVLPIASLLFYLLNMLLVRVLRRENIQATQIIVWASLLPISLLLLSMVHTILLVL